MILCLGPTPTVQRTMTFGALRLDQVNRAISVHEYASGKSTNAARVLHELGCPALTTGFLGGDRGIFFRSDLDRAGIAHDFVMVEPSTRLCITAIDEQAQTATELLEESNPVTQADYSALLAKLKQHLASADLLILSGTLLAGAEPDFYAHCIQLAPPKVRIILDTAGPALLQAMPARPFIVKPNRSEIERTLGISIDSDNLLRDAMLQLVSRGATWVITTSGKAGTLITNGKSFWQIDPPTVKVISPIGSGDSFAAGLAAGLSKNEAVPQACILATACGSANAMTPFAGHVNRNDVASLQLQLKIKKLT